jgi:hypothetical protein
MTHRGGRVSTQHGLPGKLPDAKKATWRFARSTWSRAISAGGSAKQGCTKVPGDFAAQRSRMSKRHAMKSRRPATSPGPDHRPTGIGKGGIGHAAPAPTTSTSLLRYHRIIISDRCGRGRRTHPHPAADLSTARCLS